MTDSVPYTTNDPDPAPTNGRPAGGGRAEARPRTVLVLGGGGMRGIAHVGVLRALATLGIEYDAIVGCSIGALVGSMAAGGFELDKIESIVSQLQKQDYFQLNVVKFLLRGVRTPSMYKGDTFRARLQEILPQASFSDMRVPFYCNAAAARVRRQRVYWGSARHGRPAARRRGVLVLRPARASSSRYERARRSTTWTAASSIPVPLRFAKHAATPT